MSDGRISGDSSPSEVLAAQAAMLGIEALGRLESLEGAGSKRPAHDQELVDAIMTDDGNPIPGGEDRPPG